MLRSMTHGPGPDNANVSGRRPSIGGAGVLGRIGLGLVAASCTLAAGESLAQVVANDDDYAIEIGETVNAPAGAGGVLDNDVNALAASVAGLPGPANGVRTVASDGSLTYTPNAGFVGLDTFQYFATNPLTDPTFDVATVSVTVSNDVPVAAPDSYNATEDTTLNVNAAAGVLSNDTDAHPLTAVLVSDVGDGTLTLNPDGSFAYTPDAEFSGEDSFTYRAVDNQAPPAESNVVQVTITVAAVNDPPVAADDSYNVMEDTTLNVNPSAGVLDNDDDPAEGDSLTAQLETDVSNGTLTLNANGSFTYVPDPNFFGDDTFTYRAIDDGTPPAQSDPATVTITVSSVNDPPVAANDSYLVDEDTTLSVNAVANGLLGNDQDIDGDPLQVDDPASVEAQVSANEGTLNLSSDGTFTFTPAAAFNGVVNLSYEATDGAATSNTATFTITVAEINDPPIASADSYETDEDTTLSVSAAEGVLANDTDEENGTLTAVLVADVNDGTLSLSNDGSFQYIPDPDFFGTDTFTYRAVDDGDPQGESAVTTVTIVVNPINDAPTAQPDNYTTDEDMSLNVAANQGVLANDNDPDPGDVLTITIGTDVASGTLALNQNGSFSYTPDQDFNGTDSFTYTLFDDATPPLQSSEVTVTITVQPVNDPPRPIAVDPDPPIPDQTATESVPIEPPIDLAAYFADPEGDPISFTVTGGLPDGVMQSAPGSSIISGTPTLDNSVRSCDPLTGEGFVDVVASDGIDDAAPVSFCLRVIEAGRTDLTLSIAASPGPALINEQVDWIFTVDNLSIEPVTSVAVDAVFTGEVPFTFAASPNCTATPVSGDTLVSCTGGPVPAGGSATIVATGSSTQAGDLLVNAVVAVEGPLPIDSDDTNNSAVGALNIAESLAGAPAQKLQVIEHRAAAAGDFNGDGFVDLAVATGPTLSTRVYANVLDPPDDPLAVKRVLSEQPLTLGDQVQGNGIAVGDLNGDGAPDLVTANGSGATNGVYLNTNAGDGSFGFSLPEPVGSDTDLSNSVAIGDVNADSLPDIVFANSSPNTLFLNRSGGIFTVAPDAEFGDESSVDVVVVDLFGNARAEMVFANTDGDALIYSQNGTSLALPTGPTTSVAAGDFDGDGRIDLVFGRADTSMGLPSNPVFLNTSSGPAGQFFPAGTLGASPTNDVLVVDTDEDGDLDVVSINATGGHQAFVNNGNGAFSLHEQQFSSAGARFGVAAKLSVDDRVDVAVTGPNGVDVFYNDGNGNIGAGDTGIPVITLLGEATIELIVEATFEDPGATAMDAVDGDLTENIVVDNPVDTAVLGTYTVTYTVTDRSGNPAVPVTRTVTVAARTGTGGGGGGAFGFWAALILVTLGAARLQGRCRTFRSTR